MLVFCWLFYHCFTGVLSANCVIPCTAKPVCPAIPVINQQRITSTAYYTNPVSLAKQLYEAQSEKNLDHFFSILQQAITNFAHDPEGFKTFLTTKNNEGWTALMHAAVTGDIVQTTAILRMLKLYYGDNQEEIFDYLNQRGPIGFSALILACEFGNTNFDYGKISQVRALVDGVAELLKGNKKLFLQFLNAADFKNENNSLINLTYDGMAGSIEYLVKKAKDFFGPESPEFDAFINYLDAENRTPLQYTLEPTVRNFLINNGAVIKSMLPPDIQQAQKIGRRIITAITDGNLEKMKKILYQAEHLFKSKQEFITLMEDRNGAGWTPLTHAVIHESLVFTQVLINYTKKILQGEDQGDIFDILTNIDYLGKTVLMTAIQRQRFKVSYVLMDEIEKYAPNKYFFYNYIISQAELNGFSILMLSVYNPTNAQSFKFIKSLLEKMDKLFGRQSREFYLFINAIDMNNYSALDYAYDKKVKELLISYGALPGKQILAAFTTNLARAQQL